jgi:hypothetical protein
VALREADKLLDDPTGNINSVGWGMMYRGGRETGIEGIIFHVKRKGYGFGALGGSPTIPGVIGNYSTDVIERVQPRIELLFIDPTDSPALSIQNENQRCQDSPISGGVQIQPAGKGWVGTLGCAVVFYGDDGKLRRGAVTNWHVATGDVNRNIHQPSSLKPWFGQVAYSPGVSFNQPNRIDISVLDVERTDGLYAPSTHTVKPEQLTLGNYSKEISKGGLGTRVARDGRTQGRIDDGKCTEIGVSIRVGYGDGTALYHDQFIVRRPSGSFSLPGDSGSFVFAYPSMEPWALLFAGGGGDTVVSPAEFAISEARVHSFQ